MSNVVKMSDYQEKEVVIDGITVKQDKDGRYCLNDVHKAADTLCTVKTSPGQWLRNENVQELIGNLITQNRVIEPVTSKAGRYGGTYAVKELVYAYAMWISPEYHLKVIRAYDRMVTDGVGVHENSAQDLLSNPLKYIKALISQAEVLVEEKERLEREAAENKPKVAFHDHVAVAENCQTIEEAAKVLGLGRNRLFRFLRTERILMEGSTLPYQKHIDQGHFQVIEKEFRKAGGEVQTYTQTVVTGKGLTYIQKRLAKESKVA